LSFLYPTALFGLALIALPIIIHLFYFRRFKKVYFSNVRFLREVKEETSMRSRLRNLLVLLLRCLAVAAIVLAFAQPYIPAPEGTRSGTRAVSIYVDNSFSMAAEGERAPLVQLAIDAARDIVSAYGPEDRFQILTNAFRGRSQRLLGQEEALLALDELAIGPASRKLSTVVNRQRAALAGAEVDERIAYLLSDFQENVTDLEPDPDSTLAVYLLPLQAPRDRNVAIDSVWLAAPVALLNQNNLLLVRVRNYGETAVSDVRLTVEYNGQTKPEGTLRIGPGETVVDSLYLNINRPGAGSAVISLTDFPVTFDDDYPIAFRTSDRIGVVHVTDDTSPPPSLSAALGLDVFDPTFVSSQTVDYGELARQDLIVITGTRDWSSGLAEQLGQYLREGGNVLLFPPRDASVEAYNRFLRTLPADELGPFEEREREVTGVNEEEFIFRDVFERQRGARELPVTLGNFTLTRYANRGQERLLTYRDGGTALAKYGVGEGNLYLSTAPYDTEYSSLPNSPELLIPMLYKMGLSTGSRRPLAYTVGRDETIEVAGRATGDRVYRLEGPGGEFIPQQRGIGNRTVLNLGEQLTEAGVYRLMVSDEEVERLAFVYDRRESELGTLSPGELESRSGAEVIDPGSLNRLEEQIRQRNEGRPLYRYFLWAALCFLLAEAMVLRFWRV
jgi:hypothetical protein